MTDPNPLTYSGLVPMLPVTNVPRTVSFYEQLGFRVGNRHVPEEGADPVWAWLYNNTAHLMVNLADEPVEATHGTVALWIYSRDVKATHAALASKGVDVGEIEYPFYNRGGEFHVHDPDGYAVFIAHSDQ